MTTNDSAVRKSPFEISELAAFDKNIERSPEAEKRHKRIAYLEQSLDQVNYGKSLFKAMGCFFIPFVIIPLFWPILLIMWIMKNRAFRMLDAQIDDALRFWDLTRDDIDTDRAVR